MCKYFNIYIANGRLGSDKSLGGKTCKASTVVDYALLSPLLFTLVNNFEILPFDPMISDVHCGIHISFSCHPDSSVDLNLQDNDTQPISRAIWDKSKHDSFLQNLNNEEINLFICRMNSLEGNFTKETVELLTSQCTSLLYNAADEAGMIKRNDFVGLSNKERRTRRSTVRPWFNSDCRKMQRQYRRVKNVCRRMNNAENFITLSDASKAYKKCLKKHFCDYKKEFIKKLRGLKNSDPKAYWKILNKSDSSRATVAQKLSIDLLAEHFRKLNTVSQVESDSFPIIDPALVSEYNFELNSPISEQEVLKSINSLKLNKACASDLILNEFLKFSKTKMLTAFTKLFNIVFTSGFIPDDWSQGIISPIYKNKGDKSNPDNYRGITILSCFGKLFTAVLNTRLNNYLENMNILAEEQAGFRKGYGTADHIFNLKCLIDLYLFRGKRLYCAFIDYKKAFDSVNRIYLWQKLLNNNIDGKIFKIVHNLYANAKSCVRIGNSKSTFFSSNIGVRQGENLSPILFSIYLNDLSEFISHAYSGLNDISSMSSILLSNNDLEVYFKLYILLYADDTVLFAESEAELQSALNAMFLYCKSWDLEVNPAKTKITIFANRKNQQAPKFIYNGQELAVDDNFVYLGTMFSYNGRFLKNSQRLFDQARKAMFSVLNKSRKLLLPVDIQLQLFDTLVAPILLYGSEVTGFEKHDILERLCIQYYKIILKAKKSTPNLMLYGELGRHPISVLIKSKMIGFWQRLVNGKQDKISNKLYSILMAMHNRDCFHSKWLLYIKGILTECGKEHFWLNQTEVPSNISKSVKAKLIETYSLSWRDSVFASPKCLNYRIFKQDFNLENYFNVLPDDLAMSFCHFRSLNHKMPIEMGRFVGTLRDDRICELCFLDKIGDEFHYMLECTYFSDARGVYLPGNLLAAPNTDAFRSMMCPVDTQDLFKVAKYCKIVLKTFQEIYRNI